MNKPLVSAIIIFLNEEKFLREAIESVFAQTYDRWELLLVDDGSSDASTAIARGYAERYPGKVLYLEHEGHENRGTGASRDLGVRHAKGEYIAFLDADDVWLPHKLERQVIIMASRPKVGMVYGATQYWHSWAGNSKGTQRDSIRELGVRPDTLVRPPLLLTLFLRGQAVIPSTSNALVRHDVIKNVGGFEAAFRGMYEDQAFYAKVCLQAPVFVSSECWDKYRQRLDSCYSGAKKTQRRRLARLSYLSWVEDYLSNQNVTDTDLWQALRNKRFRYRHPTLYKLPRRIRYWVGQMKRITRELARRTLPASVRRSFRSQ